MQGQVMVIPDASQTRQDPCAVLLPNAPKRLDIGWTQPWSTGDTWNEEDDEGPKDQCNAYNLADKITRAREERANVTSEVLSSEGRD